MRDLKWLVTTFPSTLEIKLRLEIGKKLSRFSLGKIYFVRGGLTCACLKSSGNKPEHSDAFTILVIG